MAKARYAICWLCRLCWLGTGLCVFIWIGSEFVTVELWGPLGAIRIKEGQVALYWGAPYHSFLGDWGTFVGVDPNGFRGGTIMRFSHPDNGIDFASRYINFSAFWGAVVLLILGLGLRLLTRRSSTNLERCECGYNLRGNVSGQCPECGRTVASTSERERGTRRIT